MLLMQSANGRQCRFSRRAEPLHSFVGAATVAIESLRADDSVTVQLLERACAVWKGQNTLDSRVRTKLAL